jgi:hypothetical protein
MMIKETNNQNPTENPIKDEHVESGFVPMFKYLILSIALGIITQFIYHWMHSGTGVNWIGILGTISFFGIFITMYGKKLYQNIDTPYFAISSLLFIAGGTALGTFVTQNAAPEVFAQRYGESTGRILQFLQLQDVFHSWWYVLLFLLMIISLVKISLRRELSWANLGFHLAHLGPVIILFGFWWDYYAGFRGLIQLVKGNETNHVWVYHRNTNRVRDSLKLDFNLLLDHFETQKFEPDHRIQIWEHSSTQPKPREALNTASSRILTTLPMKVDKPWKIYNSDISFQLKEFYPNFYFEYSYPEDKDSVEAKDPGILVEIRNPHGSNIVQLSGIQPGKNQMNDPILRTTFEFYWELPDELSEKIDLSIPDQNWEGKNRIIFAGKEKKIYEVYQGKLTTRELTNKTLFPIHGNSKSHYSIVHLYPNVQYLSAEPATRNELQENPVAKLEIARDAWDNTKDAFIFPHKGKGNGQYLIPGTSYFLALESIKDQETKFWKSDLSILDKTGSLVKQRSIKVNEPLLFKGYRFYQTGYDPNNPNYSGIGVSYTPGLMVIYFGFTVLVVGVFVLFYMRSKKMPAIEVAQTV